jgi:hypothetical protein
MQTYGPAITLLVIGAVAFVVGMLFALRERKQHQAEQRRTN